MCVCVLVCISACVGTFCASAFFQFNLFLVSFFLFSFSFDFLKIITINIKKLGAGAEARGGGDNSDTASCIASCIELYNIDTMYKDSRREVTNGSLWGKCQ